MRTVIVKRTNKTKKTKKTKRTNRTKKTKRTKQKNKKSRRFVRGQTGGSSDFFELYQGLPWQEEVLIGGSGAVTVAIMLISYLVFYKKIPIGALSDIVSGKAELRAVLRGYSEPTEYLDKINYNDIGYFREIENYAENNNVDISGFNDIKIWRKPSTYQGGDENWAKTWITSEAVKQRDLEDNEELQVGRMGTILTRKKLEADISESVEEYLIGGRFSSSREAYNHFLSHGRPSRETEGPYSPSDRTGNSDSILWKLWKKEVEGRGWGGSEDQSSTPLDTSSNPVNTETVDLSDAK